MAKRNEDQLLYKVQQNFDCELVAAEFILVRQEEVSKYTIGAIRNALKQFFVHCNGSVEEQGLKLKVLQFLNGKGNEYYNKQLQALNKNARSAIILSNPTNFPSPPVTTAPTSTSPASSAKPTH